MGRRARLVAALGGLLAGCFGGLRVDTSVELVNATDQDLPEVVLQVAGEEVWRGPLADGERRQVTYAVNKDGGFQVSGKTASGEAFSSEPLGYTTPHDGQDHQLELLPGGEVRYSLGR